MGFKINKGKSWKNLGKKAGKDISSKKKWEGMGKNMKNGLDNKKPWEDMGNKMKSISDKDTWEGIGKGMERRSQNMGKSLSRGMNRAVDGITPDMKPFLIAAGVIVAGGAIMYLTDDTKNRD
jgi:hypothetical protein